MRFPVRVPLVAATVAGVLVLAACSAGKAPSPAPEGGAPSQPTAAAPTATRAPGASPAPALDSITSAALSLEVSAPADETMVRASPVEVRGRTAPDAVVTVNGSVAPVGADGAFASAVAVDEGPNSIEVIASDFRGNLASRAITVVYIR